MIFEYNVYGLLVALKTTTLFWILAVTAMFLTLLKAMLKISLDSNITTSCKSALTHYYSNSVGCETLL